MTIREELEQIRLLSPDGILRPSAVVEWARTHPESELHTRFDWDADVAAQRWLLQQAQDIIRATVTYIGDGPKHVRVYISLDEDRANGGGYRHIIDVSASKALRESMLAQARRDANAFESKYRDLEEFAGVIAAMRATKSA